MKHTVKLPHLGENIEAGTVAQILVAIDDAVNEGDGIIELETDKAVLEVPADKSGVLREILVSEGDEVKIDQPIAILEIGQNSEREQKVISENRISEKEDLPDSASESEKNKNQPRDETSESASPEHETKSAKQRGSDTQKESDEKEATQDLQHEPPPQRDYIPIPASPSIRRFAREIGIDINDVRGSGPRGRISMEDVRTFSKDINKRMKITQTVSSSPRSERLPDFSKWGNIEEEKMSRIREKTAHHLGFAWSTIPHVTHFDKADITELEEQRKYFGKYVEKAGAKLTMTAILVKFVQFALKSFPQVNSSIDMSHNNIIHKKYYHIGVAVDTDRGLLVPVIKNVDKKNITQIALELQDLAEKARVKKLTLEDMEGSTFTISNLGGIGGTGFTPIVNSPDVAILAVSRAKVEPVYINEKFEPRLLLPLGLSYDHRLIDGADAARFLRWICDSLEKPLKIFIDGQ